MNRLSTWMLRTVIVGLFALSVSGCSRLTDHIGPQSNSAANSEFQSRIDGPGLVLVKFGATWCGPCVQVDRELQKLEELAQGRAEIIKIDIDEEPSLARQFGISSIPRLILFRDGQEVHDAVGFVKAEEMNSWLASANPTSGQVVNNPYVQ